MHRRRWSTDLPPDLLREISGRLHAAADFVRFHAVCRSWRDSHTRDDMPKCRTKQFLPWLLPPNDDYTETIIKIRCVFSRTSYRAPPTAHERSWVIDADGTAVRYFTAGPCSGLQDPLTGAQTLLLPPFPHRSDQWEQKDNPTGIVYGDGTVLLFGDWPGDRFKAALLRPGDAAWTLVEREIRSEHGEFCVVYHGGKILVTGDYPLWQVITPNEAVASDVQVPMPWMCDDYLYWHCYVLESRGELLWASVHIREDYAGGCSLVSALDLRVHALEQASAPDKVPRWVRKDGRSLADRVLFLGWPNSFAMDASQLSGYGGYAYFVCHDQHRWSDKRYGVVRYSLIDDKAELVEWLPQAWHYEVCTWFLPQPNIAPIQEIRGRLLDAPRRKKLQEEQSVSTTPLSSIHIDRPQQPFFRVMVRNLPLSVNNSQLRYLFNRHGKVSNAEVIYYKKTKASQGIGFVTISTVHDQQADALAALNRLVIDGCRLEVTLVKKRRQRHRTTVSSAGRSVTY